MEFYDVVHKRRAIRQFKPDMVPQDVVMRVLDAANWAPSGMNMQQWGFIVASGEKKKQLGECYGKAAEKMFQGMDEERRKMMVNSAREFNGAPIVIVALTVADPNPFQGKMHLESASAALENLLLAACAEGLGTCWALGPLLEEAEIRRILNIPPEKEIVALTPLGYPAVDPPAPLREDPDLAKKFTWVE